MTDTHQEIWVMRNGQPEQFFFLKGNNTYQGLLHGFTKEGILLKAIQLQKDIIAKAEAEIARLDALREVEV